jgi:ArsR family transcriptional regulator, lead/cadmium/zinc/bismuth-responsive transcriptional repressor
MAKKEDEMIDICQIRCIHQVSVNKAREGRTDDTVLEEAAALLGVISDPTRLKIMDALRLGELCVCDLAAVLGMSVSAISHQLRLLRASRLVRGRRAGKVVFYALHDAHVEKLLGMAIDHCRERCGI